jgi:uncharacterized membrane protein YhaH (DUF805 family)
MINKLKRLMSLQSRANRKTYWLIMLTQILSIFGIVAAVAICTGFLVSASNGVWFVILFPVTLFLIWIGFAAVIRRLHDRDMSGWWILFFYVVPNILSSAVDKNSNLNGAQVLVMVAAFVISVWGLVEIGFRRGTPGPNRFGPMPS